MDKYIPYSIRHNISDPDLAGLLDYLEREMGWDIEHTDGVGLAFYIRYRRGFSDQLTIRIEQYGPEKMVEIKRWEGVERKYCEVRFDLFFSTYKTLLPVIRDLYGK